MLHRRHYFNRWLFTCSYLTSLKVSFRSINFHLEICGFNFVLSLRFLNLSLNTLLFKLLIYFCFKIIWHNGLSSRLLLFSDRVKMLIPCFPICSLALIVAIQNCTCLVIFFVDLLKVTIFPSTMPLLIWFESVILLSTQLSWNQVSIIPLKIVCERTTCLTGFVTSFSILRS